MRGRKLVIRTIRLVKTWKCSTCKSEYKSKRTAEKCASMPVEDKKFKIGDRVTAKGQRVCLSAHRKQKYILNGKISRIIGSEAPDEEYWNKWLGGQPDMHVFSYEVKYRCPRCGKKKGAVYFAPELKKVQ